MEGTWACNYRIDECALKIIEEKGLKGALDARKRLETTVSEARERFGGRRMIAGRTAGEEPHSKRRVVYNVPGKV